MVSGNFASDSGLVSGTARDDGARGAVPDEASYDLDVEATFSNPELVLAPTLSSCPGATFQLDFRTACADDADHLHVSVRGSDGDCIRRALERDRTVAEANHVATFGTERVVRVEAATTARRFLPVLVEIGGYVRSVRGRGEGWTVRTYLPNRSTLKTLTARCRDRDVNVHVSRLSDLDGADVSSGAGLTGSQRRLLLAAVEGGYFDSPRRVSQRQLATEFDVSPSAISQRLRAATGSVVTHALLEE